ncbi:hypothetical protein ACFWA9_10240 [Kitasatospora sp. NPDC059973]|uniref:hypothetical protein n=1 Tax=Kitasatospora sp. NPDC059973 TaxID=3347020 RepID=UPI003688E6CB
MTAVLIALIRCDGPDCGAETHTPFETSRASVVRRFRRPGGWRTRPGGRDLCPACWKTGHR